MTRSDYDFILVGQGLAGSVLSNMLIEKGNKVLVIDQFNQNASSQVAAGLVNPVTGRRVVKSWMADALLPFASAYYQQQEKESGCNFYFPMDVIEVIHSIKELNEWTSRTVDSEMKKYFTDHAPEENYKGKIAEFKKMMRINSSGWMNIPLFVDICRERLKLSLSLLEEEFDYRELAINADSIEYRNIKASKIIFCEGYKSIFNPLWKWLPFVPAKGEILTICCESLPEDFILLSGIFLIPLGNHHFRVGSTYEWNFPHELPTEAGKEKLLNLINKFLRVSFEIMEHKAGVRPTVKDRRPFIGAHPDYNNVFIFNGMGTKGVQLVPFFGEQFVKVLAGNGKLLEVVNVERFYK